MNAPNDAAVANALEAPRLLVIDDNPADRELVSRELLRHFPRARIREVRTRAELDAALAADDYDLAITDYQLLFSTGLEVLRSVKARDPMRPVIMFTASGSEEVAANALHDGLDDYITKAPKHYARVPRAASAALLRAVQRVQLEREREQLRTLFDVMPVGIAIAHDPMGDRITLQPRFEQWLGLAPGSNASLSGPQAASLPYRCQREGADIPPGELPMQRAARSGAEVRDAEFDIIRNDGEVLHMLMNAAPLFDADGRVRGAVGAAMDVTTLKRVQRSLELASRQKDEFLAMLAHELRNPLAPIRNACELLARMAAATPETERVAAMIRRQVVHLARLVDDLLDVSRIERGRIELKQQTVSLADIVAQALETVDPLLREKQHDVSIVAGYAALYVHGDPARLVQCVANVLANAAKYTDAGGRIVVATSEQAGEAVVEVTDNGMGIAAELLPHVFDLFVQSERTLDRAQGGLGIGLTLVRRLIEMHGGTVSAHSPGPGRGATIVLRLPVAAPPPPAVAERPADTALCRVLIVDDNVDAATSLAMVLELEGHDVVPVYSARSALTHVAAHEIDTALLDIGLPGMDGYELARRLRAMPGGARLQLIAMTGYGQADDRNRALAAGFDDHVVKPVDPAWLRERLCRQAARP